MKAALQKLVLITIICLAIQSVRAQSIIYVDSANISGTHNGISWATAYDSLQVAINNATVGDSIFVAKGTYQRNSTQFFSMKDSVKIFGGFTASTDSTFALRNWSANPSVLKGNDTCVIINQNLSVATILDGFTILGGTTNSNGGGMYNTTNSSPTLRNLIFVNNSASYAGGGMYNYLSSPTLSNVSFKNNSVVDYGGGMYNYYSNPTLTNVIFDNNVASQFNAGGMYNAYSSPNLNRVVFCNNTAGFDGGGMFNELSSNASLTNVVFYNNSSLAFDGGGMYNYSSSPKLNGVTFFDNGKYAMSNVSSSSPQIVNTIFWGNANGDINGSTTTTITYSFTQSAITGAGNVQGSSTPFVNDALPAGADGNWMTADDGLQLVCNSPVVNTGRNDSVPNGDTTDIVGAMRIFGGKVDMGAYEDLQIATVNILGDTAICSGDSLTLIANATGNTPISYLWSDSSTDSSIDVDTLGTYFVTVTDNNGCINSDTLKVTTINPLPIVSIMGNSNPISGSADTLTASGAVTYIWNTGSAFDTTIIHPTSSGSYSVIGTDSNGCSATDTINITTKPNGITALYQGKTTLYPTLAHNTLYLKIENFVGSTDEINLRIINVVGKTVMKKTIAYNQNKIVTIDISRLVKGMYFIQLDGKQSLKMKFVKN